MMRIGLAAGLIAAIGIAGFYGVKWLREDAQADLLRDLQLQQVERTEADIAERAARKQEIENASPAELRERACAGGMLPPDACP